jgi:hypothetical protein
VRRLKNPGLSLAIEPRLELILSQQDRHTVVNANQDLFGSVMIMVHESDGSGSDCV